MKELENRMRFSFFLPSSFVSHLQNEGNEFNSELRVRSIRGVNQPADQRQNLGLRGKMEAGWARMNGESS